MRVARLTDPPIEFAAAQSGSKQRHLFRIKFIRPELIRIWLIYSSLQLSHTPEDRGVDFETIQRRCGALSPDDLTRRSKSFPINWGFAAICYRPESFHWPP